MEIWDKYTERVTNLMPAPGWRVAACWIYGDDVSFDFIPVVGWASIHREPLKREYDALDDIVDLLVCHEGRVLRLRFFGEEGHAEARELPPGQELDDELKAELEKEVRDKMKPQRRVGAA